MDDVLCRLSYTWSPFLPRVTSITGLLHCHVSDKHLYIIYTLTYPLISFFLSPMESIPLRFMKPTAPTTKRHPIHLAPQRTPASASASAWKDSKKRGKAAVLQATERRKRRPAEKAEELEREGYWEWREMDKCRGCGMVELMECLEREAIMGEDQGKDPIDYSRRAHIFDKSSKIFQALKTTST